MFLPVLSHGLNLESCLRELCRSYCQSCKQSGKLWSRQVLGLLSTVQVVRGTVEQAGVGANHCQFIRTGGLAADVSSAR